MGCFDNLIGIKSACQLIEGSSGINMEDFGITCKEADSYINAEYETGQQLIEDKIAFATKLVSKTVQNYFDGQINTRQLLQSETLGTYQDNLQAQPVSIGNQGGVNISLNNNASYLDVFVNSLSLQVNYTGDVPVFVYNLVTGELIDTITIPCVSGSISSKAINKTYSSQRQKLDLLFAYDVSTISSYKSVLDYYGCGSCSGFRFSNYYINATPAIIGSGDAKIRSSMTSQSHTYGLSINYSVQCNVSNWLCNLTNILALPIGYKASEEIMNYANLISDRTNSSTTIDGERNEKRAEFYKENYIEHINTALKGIVLPKNDVCFTCNDVLRTAIILP